MAKRLCGSRRSIPFAFYRSGTSRGIFVLEQDVPPKGPERNAILSKIMGSGHPQQLEGFGGGCGPTSKAVVVGKHEDPMSVTYAFVQCKVSEMGVDESHGDCGNMIAAVAPFAIEQGLVPPAEPLGTTTRVQIHSLNTGSLYAADVQISTDGNEAMVNYAGDCTVAGVPSAAAPVQISSLGIAGSQTGSLLPTGHAIDQFALGNGLGDVSVTIVDFARALIMLDGNEVLPKFGYASWSEATKDRIESDSALNAALENIRRAASLAIGMGDCTGKDAPKVALLAPPTGEEQNALACRYYVNPGRSEMHPTVAMTAAQAIGTACLVEGSIARRSLRAKPVSKTTGGTFEFQLEHVKGTFPVSIGISKVAASRKGLPVTLFPEGVPTSGMYTTSVLPLAEGRAFV